MKMEIVQLLTEITKQAILNRMTFKEAWLVFGAAMYSGYRDLDCIRELPADIPPWSKDSILPDLSLPPNEL